MLKTKKIMPYIFALGHYLIAIVFSLNNFDYSLAFEEHIKVFVVSQFLVIITLIAIYKFGFKYCIYREKYKENIKIFFIYFIINIILLLIVWPRSMEI